MSKPQVMMNVRDFEARLERLGPTEKLVPLAENETRAVWVRQRDGGGKATIILSFAMTLDEANAALARLAAKGNPKPSVDLS